MVKGTLRLGKIKEAGTGKTALRALLVTLGVLTVAGAAPLGLEKTIETSANPRVTLFNLAGHVSVTGWEKTQVHLSSTSATPQVEVELEQLPAQGRADKIHLTTHILDPNLTSQQQSCDYILEVPAGADLEIRNPEGSVRIANIRGEAFVDSVGGTITASDVSGHLGVRSIGGDIEVVRPSGRVEASSVNGSLRFVSPATPQLRASTTSGKIFYEGDFAPGGDYHLTEYSGDMEILTPPSASFELRANSVRGKVVADPELAVTPGRHSVSPLYGGNRLFGTHNTGQATVELHSFSGNIQIRRLH